MSLSFLNHEMGRAYQSWHWVSTHLYSVRSTRERGASARSWAWVSYLECSPKTFWKVLWVSNSELKAPPSSCPPVSITGTAVATQHPRVAQLQMQQMQRRERRARPSGLPEVRRGAGRLLGETLRDGIGVCPMTGGRGFEWKVPV